MTSTTRLGLLIAALSLGAAGQTHAQSFAYGSNQTGIHRINLTTGASTLVYSGAPFPAGAAVAALAQRPSDGMLFFIVGTSGDDQVYRWVPATPATAAVSLGATGAVIPYMPRLGFHATTGVMYGVNVNTTQIYTINQTTGVAAASGAALTGGPLNTGGDLAIHPTTNLLYIPTNNGATHTLYRVPLTGGALTNVGAMTGLPGNLSGAAFNSAGTLFVQSSVSNNLYTVPITAGAATLIGAMGGAFQDMASVAAPPPTVALSFSPASIGQGSTSIFTVTLTNTGIDAQRGAAFTLSYPAGQVNAAVPSGATTCGGTVTATAGAGTVALSAGSIPAGASCTVTVSVTRTTVGASANTLAAGAMTTIYGGNVAAANATLTILARAVAVGTDGVDTLLRLPSNAVGQYSYAFTVTNSGAVIDTFDLLASAGPAGLFLTVDSIRGPGVTSGALPDSARLSSLGIGASASVTVWFRVGNGTTGALDTLRLRAQAVVYTTAQDSGWANVRIGRPALAIDKSVNPTGASAPGTDLTYTVTITNGGTQPAATVVAVDSVPPEVRFNVGSTNTSLPPSVSATVEYSNNGGVTWTYVPASGACSAPASYDNCVNRLRMTLLNPLPSQLPNNTATLTFIAQIR